MTAAAMMVSCGKKQPKTPEPVKPTEQVERIDTLATLVMQIQKCSRLYTTEYQVHKIVTHDDDIKLKYLNLAHPDADALHAIQEKYYAHIRFASLLGCGMVGTETGAPKAE